MTITITFVKLPISCNIFIMPMARNFLSHFWCSRWYSLGKRPKHEHAFCRVVHNNLVACHFMNPDTLNVALSRGQGQTTTSSLTGLKLDFNLMSMANNTNNVNRPTMYTICNSPQRTGLVVTWIHVATWIVVTLPSFRLASLNTVYFCKLTVSIIDSFLSLHSNLPSHTFI